MGKVIPLDGNQKYQEKKLSYQKDPNLIDRGIEGMMNMKKKREIETF
jgi:hypothetical protein